MKSSGPVFSSDAWTTRPTGLLLLLVRLFLLLSPAHDGNEAHCEDILANGGGGGGSFFGPLGFARRKRGLSKWPVCLLQVW
jgi:hypothetical protein